MATSVSSRKISTIWSVRRAGCILPLSADVVEGVVTDHGRGAARRDDSRGRCAVWGRHIAWVGATGTAGAYRHRIAPRLSSSPTMPLFAGEPRDIVGLYVDRLGDAGLPLRTQPGLPKKKGRLGNLTHDWKRNGTTTFVRRPRPARLHAGQHKSVIKVRDMADHLSRLDRSRGLTPVLCHLASPLAQLRMVQPDC